MRYQLYAEASYDHNFITRWVELLIQGPRPLVLETSGSSGMHEMLMQLLSKKGGEELTGKLKKSIRDILSPDHHLYGYRPGGILLKHIHSYILT